MSADEEQFPVSAFIFAAPAYLLLHAHFESLPAPI